MNNSSDNKIDVEELMNDFRIQDIEALHIYLKELWKDLSQRSDNQSKGINLVTFNSYYKLPGIILDRLFNIFDGNNNGYIDINEFCSGMETLFTANFNSLIKLIFNFYDFDKDGYITKEDIRTILSYIPLNTSNKYHQDKMKFEKEEFKDRVESQEELNRILDNIFHKQPKIDFKTYLDVVENKSSEIFIYLIIFLLENRPFNKKTLNAYQSMKKNDKIKSPTIIKKLIASPSLQSKFSPSMTIGKSPTMTKKILGGGKKIGEGISMLNKLTGKSEPSQQNKLSQYTNTTTKKDTEDKNSNSINPARKQMKTLRNLEDIGGNKKVEKKTDHNSPNLGPVRKYENEGKSVIKNDDDDESEEIKMEGFLWKITNNQKFKKLWFTQIDKDIFCKFIFLLNNIINKFK
jgi:Ca2+-binding EF-hand superfamily protein